MLTSAKVTGATRGSPIARSHSHPASDPRVGGARTAPPTAKCKWLRASGEQDAATIERCERLTRNTAIR